MEHFNVTPDFMTMAKGIADGFPLGACITRSDIGNAFEPGDHFSSFGGNPISSAAALANIDFMVNTKLSDKAEEDGNYILKRLTELKDIYEIIGDVRGKGLMIGIELVKDQEKLIPAKDETKKI